MQLGQHVLCIKDCTPLIHHGVEIISPAELIIPQVGIVYTIKEIEIGIYTKLPCIALAELRVQVVTLRANNNLFKIRMLFRADHFKPLSRLTIEQFTGVTIDV